MTGLKTGHYIAGRTVIWFLGSAARNVMRSKMSRREALRLGTNAAVSAAITPLLSANAAETKTSAGNAGHTGGYLFLARGGYGQGDPREGAFRAGSDAGAPEADQPREFQGQCDRYAGCGGAVDGAGGCRGRVAC